jgi:hypothetical protein
MCPRLVLFYFFNLSMGESTIKCTKKLVFFMLFYLNKNKKFKTIMHSIMLSKSEYQVLKTWYIIINYVKNVLN